MDFGVQLHLPTLRGRNTREIVDLGATAADLGFTQIWLTDNLESRSIFAVLGAMAAGVKCDLGAAVIGQYFHNPVEIATALTAVSEVMGGRRLYAGIGSGNPFTGAMIQTPLAIRFLRETAESVRRLLIGERLEFAACPTVAEYFRFRPEASAQLAYVTHPREIKVLGGGNGPLGLATARDVMDGVILGWSSLPALRVGRLPAMLATLAAAPAGGPRQGGFVKVMEVKISVASRSAAAREFIRQTQAPSRILNLLRRGYTPDEFEMLGIPMAVVSALEAEFQQAGRPAGRGDLVHDSMIDWLFVAGDSEYCVARLAELVTLAQQHHVQQIMLSVLGPEPLEAVDLLANRVVPAVRQRAGDGTQTA